MYFDRDSIQTERESQTEDLAEKTEELIDRVTSFKVGRRPHMKQLQRRLYYRTKFRTIVVQLYGSVPHVWEAVLLAVQLNRGVLGFNWGCLVFLSGTASLGLGD